MNQWRLTPAARADLTHIWNYTANRWGEAQAEHYVRQIENDLTGAAEGSKVVRPIDGVWRVKSGRHLCIFRKLPGEEIEVIRVLHEQMDVDRHL
ncbi:MAG: type II toxin-antitoxin system RelE/ParE family toxin [Albidovulum sp.]